MGRAALVETRQTVDLLGRRQCRTALVPVRINRSVRCRIHAADSLSLAW